MQLLSILELCNFETAPGRFEISNEKDICELYWLGYGSILSGCLTDDGEEGTLKYIDLVISNNMKPKIVGFTIEPELDQEMKENIARAIRVDFFKMAEWNSSPETPAGPKIDPINSAQLVLNTTHNDSNCDRW